MSYKLLLSGERADFTTLEFDDDQKELRVIGNYEAPFNASWVERASSHGTVDRLIGLSEGDDAGLLYTFEIDHARNTSRITSQQPTLGAPAHFTTLHGGSALALSTYYGGSVALYPISVTHADGLLLDNVARTELFPTFTYASAKHGPNQVRQRQCHPHQVVQNKRGFLYAPDLGSDRVWILSTDEKLEMRGWLQCPPGTGPRHLVLNPDESIMYVIGELSHTVLAYDISNAPADAIPPIEGFTPNIIPPTAHPEHHAMMDSAEICFGPHRRVLYVSNRWERQAHGDIATRPPGDAVAIILLSEDGRSVQSVKHVRTNVDTIRGMRLSEDGSFVVVCGQEGGGVEIYAIGGDRGDEWTLVAALNEGLEGGIKHAIWI